MNPGDQFNAYLKIERKGKAHCANPFEVIEDPEDSKITLAKGLGLGGKYNIDKEKFRLEVI